MKRGLLSSDRIQVLVELMSRLNRKSAEIMKEFIVHAVTDVTGFGLLGHLHEITKGSSVDAELRIQDVPVLDEVKEMLASNVIPGGTVNNLDFVKDFISAGKDVSRIEQLMLADAQTSGGLLFTIPPQEVERIQQKFNEENEPFFIIGKILGKGEGTIYLSKNKR